METDFFFQLICDTVSSQKAYKSKGVMRYDVAIEKVKTWIDQLTLVLGNILHLWEKKMGYGRVDSKFVT